jgi:hypothetical protein
MYPDLSDPLSLYYSPRATWGPLDVLPSGGLTRISGEISLDISPIDRQALQKQYPGKKIAPLVPLLISGNGHLSVQIPQPHSLNVTSLNSFPYPRLMLNGFLQNSQPDYTILLKGIKDGWASRTLIAGPITLEFDAVDAGAAYQISLDYSKVHDDLCKLLGAQVHSLFQVSATLSSYAQQKFDSFASPLNSAVSGAQKDEVGTLVSQELWNTFLYKAEALFTFDSGRAVDGYLIREAREVGVGSTFVLTKSIRQKLLLHALP